MSLPLDEKTLESVANNGEMDYDKWPSILEPLLQRMNQIVYTDFPMPRPYPTITRPTFPPSPTQTQTTPARDSNSSLQTPSTPVRNLPPVPPFPTSSATSTSHVPDSLPPSQNPPSEPPNELPALLLQILTSVTHTLRSAFSDHPPHTIQRLAELILEPTKHYKTLPAWLRAVDRVVSVSSSADIFPLSDTPPVVNGVNGDGAGGILWSNNDARNGYDSNSLGSDESLGGALLTPIPWLRNGAIGGEDSSEDSTQLDSINSGSTDGFDDQILLPNTHGDVDPLVPERADGAVTQGELMRLEQEAGVIPVSHGPQDTVVNRNIAGSEEGLYLDEAELVPHARGPDVVGSVDMGRVGGQDVEIHIGSPPGETEAEGNKVDANDAQAILPSTNNPTTSTDTTAGEATAGSEGFEIVSKDTADGSDADAMQVDQVGAPEKKDQLSTDEQDGDIVLVDHDAKANDEVDGKAEAAVESTVADSADGNTMT